MGDLLIFMPKQKQVDKLTEETLKFYRKDVEYWEMQMDYYPTKLTEQSLALAKFRLENILEEINK